MKTNIKTIALFLTATQVVMGSAMAQTESETITARKVKKEEVPVAVVESIEEDFPEMKVQEWTILPKEAYQDKWVVNKREENVSDPETFDPQYYAIGYNGKGIKGEALYNAKGDLLHSKEVIKDEALPYAIAKKIEDDYPGYQMVKDKEVIKDGKKHTEYYQVGVKKGNDKETLYFDEDGDLMQSKKRMDKDS